MTNSDSYNYLQYSKLLQQQFSQRIQKISINAGFTCPNRDGSKGAGGCTYCNNQAFAPEYCQPTKSVSQQIAEGIDFFHHKYENQLYFAYFQSYTNTYGDFNKLISLYEEALAHPKVVGLAIGTRPDCINDKLLDYFQNLAKKYYVMLEYGVESTDDRTLRAVNRGHDYACAVQAIVKTAARGINTAAHLILGLPGETREIILSHADRLSQLPLTALKLHQLQIIKGTEMAREFTENPARFTVYNADEYVDLAVDFLERLNPNIAVERFVSQSPPELLLAPDWGLKNFEFNHKIERRLRERKPWQGRLIVNYI